MKIAIHHRKGSFSEDWIGYCKREHIPYKLVDAYRNDILQQVEDCDVFMWHFHHTSSRDTLLAKELIFSLQASKKRVFPDFHTCWHFDDKVGQKYALESIGAPLVPSYVFYEKSEAFRWLQEAIFPKVFKLRSGSGSSHVQLVKTTSEAKKLIRQSFGKGFSKYDKWANLRERVRKFKNGKTDLFNVLKGLARLGRSPEFAKIAGRERGYAYFQDFIPGNDSDTRVIVVGDKAFAIKRLNRENDFRASGSGEIVYRKEEFDLNTIRLAFQNAEKLKSQSLALDFIYDEEKPLIVEMSYGYTKEGYEKCEGYWDRNLNWHPGPFNAQHWMVQELVNLSNS